MAVGQPSGDRAGRYDRVGAARKAKNAASWEDAEADTLWRAVTAVTSMGDAIMLALTQDGGACVLVLMSGNQRVKEYATGPAEIASLLADTLASTKDAE